MSWYLDVWTITYHFVKSKKISKNQVSQSGKSSKVSQEGQSIKSCESCLPPHLETFGLVLKASLSIPLGL